MEVKQAVSALAALAHEYRLGIFRMLVEQGPGGLPAGVISERLGIPSSSLTFHLQQLMHADLVSQRRASRQLIYAADFSAMNGLVAYLNENCCASRTEGASVCDPGCMPELVPPAVLAPRTRREPA